MSRSEKFAEFDKAMSQAKANEVDELRIHHPEVLGDDYEELVQNLSIVAEAKVALVLVPRASRTGYKRGGVSAEHEQKFAQFNVMLAEAKAKKLDAVIVYRPQVLGDNYGELVENLNRLSDVEMKLYITTGA